MKDAEDAGFSFFEAKPLPEPKNHMALKVEIKMDEIPEEFMKVRLERKTRRATIVNFYHFKYRDGILSFWISSKLEESFFRVYHPVIKERITMTFPDFCWYFTEGSSPLTKGEVDTPIKDDKQLGDLSSVLPQKFMEDVIESAHVLNETILEGIMQHAVFHGPYIYQ